MLCISLNVTQGLLSGFIDTLWLVLTLYTFGHYATYHLDCLIFMCVQYKRGTKRNKLILFYLKMMGIWEFGLQLVNHQVI